MFYIYQYFFTPHQRYHLHTPGGNTFKGWIKKRRVKKLDAVGMSTVPEVIVANHMGLPCCAISVLTDDCDPDDLKPAVISEIIKIAGKAEKKLTELYVELISEL